APVRTRLIRQEFWIGSHSVLLARPGGDPLPFRERGRHCRGESSHRGGEIYFALSHTCIRHFAPSALDLAPRLAYSLPTGLRCESTFRKRAGDALGTLMPMLGGAPLCRSIDAVLFLRSVLTSHDTLGGIRRHTELAQVP